MAKEPMDGPHELRLENRARLSVNGVREVESFDEESVVAERRVDLVVRAAGDHRVQAPHLGRCEDDVGGDADDQRAGFDARQRPFHAAPSAPCVCLS